MAEAVLNYLGAATLSVGNTPVGPAYPTQFLNNEQRYANKTVRHMRVRVLNQPVRWSSDPANPPTAIGGAYIPPITVDPRGLEFMDPEADFNQVCMNFKAVRDASATAPATLEFAFFS